MTEEPYYIECGYQGKTQRLEFDYGNPSLEDWADAFKSVLRFLTFGETSIKKVFPNLEMMDEICTGSKPDNLCPVCQSPVEDGVRYLCKSCGELSMDYEYPQDK